MTDKVTTDRRTILKTVGGVAACTTVGSLAAGSAAASHNDDGTAVRVNQVGYPKDGHKIAVVTSEFADVSSVSSFEVRDASGKVVHSGSLSSAMKDGSPGSGHTVKRADFTAVTTAGEYTVVVGDHESRPFEIGSPNSVYGDLLVDVGRLYTLKRANADINDPVTGLDIGPGHMQDKNAIIAEPRTSDFLKHHNAGDTIDVTGGWYDAGDYGKYVVTHGVTAAQMMLAYERNPEVFSVGQFNIPDSLNDPNVGKMPDVLAEVKYGMKFLTKMQRQDGALFFKLAGKSWPGMEVSPKEDDQKRYVFGLSSAGTALAVGAFAMAARVYQDHDPEYADQMLSRAKKGFQWLQDNPDVVWEMSVDQNSGSGGYTRSSNDAADRYWAAAELYRTTSDSTYDEYIQNGLPKYEKYDGTMVDLPAGVRSPISWNNPISLGHYAYAKTDGQSSSVARTALVKGVYITQRYQTGFPDIHNDAYTTGLYSYYWGCANAGVSRATQVVWGVEMSNKSWITKDSSYWKWATEPLHHVLGRSATGYSYVTGHGELSTENPHDRIIQSQNMDEPIPGMLVGGPHNNVFGSGLEGETTSEHVSRSTPHAMSYYDDHGAYATNEWAINYTAPLFLALADVPGMKAKQDSDDNDDENDGDKNTVSLDLSTKEINADGTTKASVMLSSAPNGLAGFKLKVSVADPSRATIENASLPSTLTAPGGGVTIADDGSSVVLQAADLEQNVQDGAQDIELATITLAGQSQGETEIAVAVQAIDNDDGSAIPVETTGAILMVGSDGGNVEPIVNGKMPTDLNGDGVYEDINGNDRADFNDVVVYINNMDESTMTNHTTAYDFNGNGQIDFDDVVSLFQNVN
jgi:endoglucanase